MKLLNFIVLFGTGIIAIAFFIALIFFKKEKPLYYKYILIFIILGLLVSINTIANNVTIWFFNKKIPILVEQTLFLFQSVMLGLFFIELLKKSLFVKKIKWLLFAAILFHITLLTLVLSTNIDVKPIISSNLFLLISCFFYLRDLMNNKPTLVLVESSSFWITMGIFFYSCVSFPVGTLIPFIPQNQEYINLRNQIFSIFNMSLIVLYLFIIKSYLCLKHPQNL